MQPPPGMPHPLGRPPFPPGPQRAPSTDPSALFAPPRPAFCAFPDDGPNIFQQAFSCVDAAVARWLRRVWWSIPRRYVNGLGNHDADVLTVALLENSWSIIIGLVCVVALCVLAWFFSPKGENQTYVHLFFSLPWPLAGGPSRSTSLYPDDVRVQGRVPRESLRSSS